MKIYRNITRILWNRGLVVLGFISLYPIMILYVAPSSPDMFAFYIMVGGSMALYAIYIMIFHYINREKLFLKQQIKDFVSLIF